MICFLNFVIFCGGASPQMVSSSEEAANTSNDVTYVDPRRWTRHMPISYLSLDAFYPMPSETTQLVEPRTVACVVLAELGEYSRSMYFYVFLFPSSNRVLLS